MATKVGTARGGELANALVASALKTSKPCKDARAKNKSIHGCLIHDAFVLLKEP
jgi:hypothetical protein